MQDDILAMVQENHARTPCNAFYLGIVPPVFPARTAVYRPLPGNYDVLDVNSCDDSCEHVKRVTLPCAKQVFLFLVNARNFSGKNREPCPVRKRGKRRVLSDFKHQVAL